MLKDILAISGFPGLFKLVSQAKNGIIVESIEDGKRMPAYASYKISALEDISVFTDNEDMKLADVFRKISEKENAKEAIDPKSSEDALRKYFAEVLPAYDKKKVYASDIKKIISWYNLLTRKGKLDLTQEQPAAEAPGEGQENVSEKASEQLSDVASDQSGK